MSRSNLLVTVGLGLGLSAALLGACKKKKDDGAPAGGGESAATGAAPSTGAAEPPAPPAKRPSEYPQAKLPALELPADDKRKEKIELGHQLFFDKRLSVDGTLACYSCHQNEQGTGGKDPIAIGPGGKALTRHAPQLWNVGYFQNAYYWDGRAKDLEAVAKAAWGGGNMGVGADNLEKKAGEIGAIKGYQPLFKAAFGDAPVTADMIASALAEYQRTFICDQTAYDKFAGGDKAALSEQQQRGLDIFLGKGACMTCHTPPYFTAAAGIDGGAFFNAGIGTAGKTDDQIDLGRQKVSSKPEDFAAFKPQSLRNITKTAPYFHDGSVATLEEAVKIMSSGGIDNPHKSPLLADRKLTDAERADLISFLGALECPGQLEVPASAPK